MSIYKVTVDEKMTTFLISEEHNLIWPKKNGKCFINVIFSQLHKNTNRSTQFNTLLKLMELRIIQTV